MKIVDLNIDCLEKIFKQLSLGDLLNVADSNGTLKKGADVVFALKYGKRKVNLRDLDFVDRNRDIDEKDNIVLYTWKRSYHILRCFGHLISNLEIHLLMSFYKAVVHNTNEIFETNLKHLIDYVAEYCAESLIELKMTGISKAGFDDQMKPMPLVKKIHILGNSTKTSLSRLFPNVQHLIYDFSSTKNFLCIDHHFPFLEQVELTSAFHVNIKKIIEKNAQICSFLRQNPQLKKLKIPFLSNANFLQTINECVPHLEHLAIVDPSDHPNLTDYGSPVHFEHVKKFELYYYHTLRREFPNISLEFSHLENVSLDLCIADNEGFYTFLSENPSITKIKLHSIDPDRKLDIPKLANILPMLREVDVRYCKYTIDEASSFVNHFQCMEKFRFILESNPDHDDNLRYLKKGWQCVKLIDIKWGVEVISYELSKIHS